MHSITQIIDEQLQPRFFKFPSGYKTNTHMPVLAKSHLRDFSARIQRTFGLSDMFLLFYE